MLRARGSGGEKRFPKVKQAKKGRGKQDEDSQNWTGGSHDSAKIQTLSKSSKVQGECIRLRKEKEKDSNAVIVLEKSERASRNEKKEEKIERGGGDGGEEKSIREGGLIL